MDTWSSPPRRGVVTDLARLPSSTESSENIVVDGGSGGESGGGNGEDFLPRRRWVVLVRLACALLLCEGGEWPVS